MVRRGSRHAVQHLDESVPLPVGPVTDAGNERIGNVLLRDNDLEIPALKVIPGAAAPLKTGGVEKGV